MSHLRKSNLHLFTIVFALGFVLFLYGLLFYVNYLDLASVGDVISFKASDLPRPLPNSSYPNPLGVHYFGDFLTIFRLSQLSNPLDAPGYIIFGYFPFATVVLGPLVLLPFWIAAVVFSVATFSACVFLLYRIAALLDNRFLVFPLSTCLLLSGPMISGIDRGNLSLVVFVLCLAGLVCHLSGHESSTGIFIGLAAAIKVYPLFFLLGFRGSRTKLTGMLTFLVGTFTPLIAYEGGVGKNLRLLVSQFLENGSPASIDSVQAYNSSFLALFTALSKSGLPVASLFVDHYLVFSSLLGILILLVCIGWETTTSERLLLIATFVCFTPRIVGQYVLLLMFIAVIALFFDERKSLVIQIQLVALAVILLPKGFSVSDSWTATSTTLTSFLNPLLGLFVMVTCVTSIRHRGPRKGSHPEIFDTN